MQYLHASPWPEKPVMFQVSHVLAIDGFSKNHSFVLCATYNKMSNIILDNFLILVLHL